MKNVLVFFVYIFVCIFTIISCKKHSENEKARHDNYYNSDEATLYIYMGTNDSIDFDTVRLLFYENDGALQIISSYQIKDRIFKTGTKIRVGIIYYKNGEIVAKSDDTKAGCEFKESTLTSGYNYIDVDLLGSCTVEKKEDTGSSEHTETEQEEEIISCSRDAVEVYSDCKYMESIESNSSFYQKAISQISDCSNYSEVICYYENQDKEPLVYLVCATQKDIESKSSFCLPHDTNKIQFGLQKYSAIKIGETSVL